VRTITKILCAIDLTKASRNAFDRALSIARVSKARLYILHAVPANYRFSWHQSERLDLLTRTCSRRSSGCADPSGCHDQGSCATVAASRSQASTACSVSRLPVSLGGSGTIHPPRTVAPTTMPALINTRFLMMY
jgi:Universal stress protein family